jgi:Zn-dependent peptidase ImmA (M78 family)
MAINPDILRWAREFSGKTIVECHEKFGAKKYNDWENGADQPKYNELQKIGLFFHKPIAVFFFSKPPQFKSIKASFRTLPDTIMTFNSKTISMLELGRIMQLNLSELHDGINPSSNLITQYHFSDKSSIKSTASELRLLLNVNLKEQQKFNSFDVAFEHWRDVFFNVGVYVFKNAFKNDNISGFCIYDDMFPVIYVNNSLSFTRQIFTLFHEMYHLISSISGVDFLDDSKYADIKQNSIERRCNEFAGAFLVPDEDFLYQTKDKIIDDNNIEILANLYSVSREVILVKLVQNNLITNEIYHNIYNTINNDNFRNIRNDDKSQNRGGNYYNTQMSYKGHHYIKLVYKSFYSNKITLPQLAQYMSMKIPAIKKLAFLHDWQTI